MNEEPAPSLPSSRTSDLTDAQRRQVVRMLDSCGVDPGDIPIDTTFRRVDGGLVLEKFIRDESGRIAVRQDGRGPVCEEIEIRPCLDLVPDWLPLD